MKKRRKQGLVPVVILGVPSTPAWPRDILTMREGSQSNSSGLACAARQHCDRSAEASAVYESIILAETTTGEGILFVLGL